MPRYFIEVAYKGTNYSGFQVQRNANTIQAEVKAALTIIFKKDFQLTGSSRTDAGVHALQNFFHFDTDELISEPEKRIYNLNAVLPDDIVVKNLIEVDDKKHCRFDALSREYKYFIYHKKDPFVADRAYYYPYHPDIEIMQQAASLILKHNDFTSFSKRNTQVNNFICDIKKSKWTKENDLIIYNVEANRFLRGMVKGLVGTMLRVGTGKISIAEFEKIIKSKDCSRADFSIPSHGLFLMKIRYEEPGKVLYDMQGCDIRTS